MKNGFGTIGFFVVAMGTFRMTYGAWPPTDGSLGEWLSSDPRAVWSLLAGTAGGMVGALIVRSMVDD